MKVIEVTTHDCEQACAICYKQVYMENRPPLDVLIHGKIAFGTLTDRWQWRPGQPSYRVTPVHRSCYYLLSELLSGEPEGSTKPLRYQSAINKRLLTLAQSRAFAWPVSRAESLKRSHAIAGKALTRSIGSLTRKTDTSWPMVDHLQRLPDEILTMIGELSFPSGLTKICAIQFTAELITNWSSASHRLQPRYLTQLHLEPGNDYVLRCDNIACRSIDIAGNNAHSGWFRLLPKEQQKDLKVIFKGLFVRDVQSSNPSVFQSSYLWNTPQPPLLPQEHSYNLPTWEMDLEAVTSNPPRKERENPVRMRQIDIPTSMTAISAAVVRHAVVGLHLHSGSSHNSSLQFYQQIKHLTEEDDIKWLCFPLHQDETIVEVGVYGPATFGKPYDDSTIVLFTSLGRPLHLGPYHCPRARVDRFWKPLVNNADSEVSAICLSDRRPGDRLRVGIICRESRQRRSFDFKPGNAELPETDDPNDFAFWPCFRSRLDASLFRSFRTCTDNHQDPLRCIGLWFHGPHGDRVLGEWREDKTISDKFDLPTTLVLVNQEERATMYVDVAEKDALSKDAEWLPIEGFLEWQTGEEHSRVIKN